MWGKGGVGKSTIAAALALLVRQHYHRVLLVSTDPTPSARQLLCRDNECGGIEVRELGEDEVKRLWVKRFGDEVYEVISSFLPVERWIIDYVAGAPGISDQFMLYYIYELARSNNYDAIVWDTVAAGASLRLLRLEKEFYTHMGDAARLYLRVRSALEKLRRGKRDPLELINSWRELAENILSMLSSSLHRAVIVSEPSRLSLAVTKSILGELRLHGIEPRLLVANKLVEENPCPGCSLVEDVVRETQEHLLGIEELGLSTIHVPYVPGEPRERVEKVAKILKEEDVLERLGLLP